MAVNVLPFPCRKEYSESFYLKDVGWVSSQTSIPFRGVGRGSPQPGRVCLQVCAEPSLGQLSGAAGSLAPQHLPEESCSVEGSISLLIGRHRPALLAIINMGHSGILAWRERILTLSFIPGQNKSIITFGISLIPTSSAC